MPLRASPALPGSFTFSGNISSRDTTAALMTYLRLKRLHRLALITSTDATGQEADRGITEAVNLPENRELAIVAQAHFAVPRSSAGISR